MKFFFRRITIITLFTTYLLILAGSIVRSTGSGMGCPDWPKCFGMWIPPTHISQLPANYKQIFKVQGKEIADFDAFKTWVEYINRLLGVVVGLQMLLMLVSSLSYWHEDKNFFILALLTFLFTGFQGWVGSVVVAKNLAEGVVTLHMLIAILIIFLLLLTSYKLYELKISRLLMSATNVKVNNFFWVAFILTLVQIILGTQVREAIDSISKIYQEQQRERWVSELGLGFYIHRSFSLVILSLHVYLLYYFFKSLSNQKENLLVLKTTWLLVILVATEILTGAILAYFSMPAFVQPLHLLLAILIASVQFLWIVRQYRSKFLMKPLVKMC